MPQRGHREVVVNRDGGYWVRSKKSNSGRDQARRRPITRGNSRERPDQSYDDIIIVEDAEHGQTVYQAPACRPRARRERSYSESQLPPRRPGEDGPRRREAVIVERVPSPPESRRRDPSASSEDGNSPPPREQDKSPRRARTLKAEKKSRRKSEVRPLRAAPPPPPPYQPPLYSQPAPSQPYYGQPMMQPPRQGNAAARFGRKLGNAAIFGVGFTAGADLLNSII